ncbi:DUF2306 domain-containing protein [Sediminicola luteus]|uniref:DUF2306 domain-containing protein n=1 Tax=Sediminicola luteus TaxID=319238 RepID=A0A2A4GDY4_9FLAO|nr:DUF2306 domain-containing protein [Sediminicola luteus]PCE66208.1 hypothetical protein B7P33_02605 [Sediminicola luteus]
MTRKLLFWFFVLLCLGVAVYPITYFLVEGNFGLLSTKPDSLLQDQRWRFFFYGHIVFGGVAMGLGWIQFVRAARTKAPFLHRIIGLFYTLAVMASGVSALYIGYFATGGPIASIGFMTLGLLWIGSTLVAYGLGKKGQYRAHAKIMVVSYALTFAAVTLRFWLPLLQVVTGDFVISYRIVAWLCWVPNLIFALTWIRKRERLPI